METLVKGTEVYGISNQCVTEVREYNYGNRLNVYIIFGNENYLRYNQDNDKYDCDNGDFYVSFVITLENN